ncbi:amidase [Rhodovulum visakhapatnamense]|uniref:Amidase n=1 Tax=Rhodovulum visakhapatnamense TaxID=364297 RepID=A0A4R8G322_9RHOB|nr:amidase [Rhodovulum visakhapatnamense]TDX33870.1 amidase [Rhodovulum visakhapatnamense]
MLIEEDAYHAFMPYPAVSVENAPQGPLSGLTLAVKDLFDVRGYRTGCGCPLKLAASREAETTAPAVQRLLEAGARFVGKTHTDELAWALYGMNPHFGTPVNPKAPDRIPGGSSSGSAVAVAAGLADIALGTDTGGSVRAPASFCGTWGLRPTHGRVPLAGAMALAPSYDTAGLFARDGATLLAAAGALMDPDPVPLPEMPDLLWPADMVAQLDEAPRAVLEAAFGTMPSREVEVYPEGADAAYAAYRVTNGGEAQETVLPFIRRSGMPLARGIDGRVAAAAALEEAEIDKARATRHAFAAHLEELLVDAVLLAPAVHAAPFALDAPDEVLEGFRHDAMRLLCVAGLAGLPQVVLPAGMVEGAPCGVSLIGPRGSDLSLVALARRLAPEAHP